MLPLLLCTRSFAVLVLVLVQAPNLAKAFLASYPSKAHYLDKPPKKPLQRGRLPVGFAKSERRESTGSRNNREYHQKPADPRVQAINECGSNWQKAISLLRESPQQTEESNVAAFNAAINVCARGRQRSKAFELLKDLLGKDLKPTPATFGGVMKACVGTGDWKSALHLMDQMEKYGHKPNVVILTNAISACGKSGQWEKALELFNSMEGRGVKPNVISYNAAISACGKSGQWEKALELFNSMEGRGVKPDVITYSAVIEALESASRFEEAAALMVEARGHGLFPKSFSSFTKVDLHDCSAAVARTILRLVLSELQSGARKSDDIIIITGRGKHSEENKAVLSGEMRSFLRDSCGLELTEVPGNEGRVVIPLDSIQKWLKT